MRSDTTARLLATAGTFMIGAALILSTWTTTPSGPPTAAALAAQGEDEEDEICPPGQRDCEIGREDPGNDPDNPDGGDGGGGGGACTFDNGSDTITVADDGSHAIEMVLAAQSGEVEVPCYLDGMGWYDGVSCYYGSLPATFHEPLPEGKTEEDGRYYQKWCMLAVEGVLPNQTQIFDGVFRWEWVDYEDVPTMTPEELARLAIANVGLDGVEFQIAPPTTGSGLVNLPVWLGITETPNTWGEIGAEECNSGLCVAISARVTSVEWNMGDGTVFTCTREQHKVWTRDKDFLSPGDDTCHHYYRQASRDQPDGRYQITATSTWTVNWQTTSGGGETGTIPTTRPSETSIQIDEIQVLTR